MGILLNTSGQIMKPSRVTMPDGTDIKNAGHELDIHDFNEKMKAQSVVHMILQSMQASEEKQMAHKVFGNEMFQNKDYNPYYDIEEHCPHCDEVLPILVDPDQIHHFYVTCPTCGGRVLLCSLCEVNCDQRDGVCQMSDPIANLKRLWSEFGDIPINDQDQLKEPFLGFDKGTDRFEVWHWFDERYPGGVAALTGTSEE